MIKATRMAVAVFMLGAPVVPLAGCDAEEEGEWREVEELRVAQLDADFDAEGEKEKGGGGKAAHVSISGLDWRTSHNEYQGIFGDCPQGATCTVTLTATNDGGSTISGLSTSWTDSVLNGGSYASVIDGCTGTTLSPGGSCDVDVDYTFPVGYGRTYPGTLAFSLPGGIIAPAQVDFNNGSTSKILFCAEDDGTLNLCD